MAQFEDCSIGTHYDIDSTLTPVRAIDQQLESYERFQRLREVSVNQGNQKYYPCR